MRPEVIFVVGYALGLLAGAVGLQRLGRASRLPRPDRSRDGRASARSDKRTPFEAEPGWPHSEVPRFYTTMSLVAAGASILLPVGELLARDHRSTETAVLSSILVLAVLTLGWLGTKLV